MDEHADEDEEVVENGILWEGSRESLEAWKEYKRQKALAFVARGYSVGWYPDGDNSMKVFIQERHYAHQPEIRAVVKFFSAPSQYGIQNGRISKLTIQECWTDVLAMVVGGKHSHVRTLYNYDRGFDFDRLGTETAARHLLDAVVMELN